MVMVKQRHQVRIKKGTRAPVARVYAWDGEAAAGSMGSQQTWEALEGQACQSSGVQTLSTDCFLLDAKGKGSRSWE